jgi:hypothetical protein
MRHHNQPLANRQDSNPPKKREHGRPGMCLISAVVVRRKPTDKTHSIPENQTIKQGGNLPISGSDWVISHPYEHVRMTDQ